MSFATQYAEEHDEPNDESVQRLVTSTLLTHFPVLDPVLHRAAELIRQTRSVAEVNVSATADVSLELEVRLGTAGERSFCTDVGRAVFERLLYLVETFPGWSKAGRWTETHDVFHHATLYDLEKTATTPIKVRTSISCAKDDGTTLRPAVLHTHKRRLGHLDVRSKIKLDTSKRDSTEKFPDREPTPVKLDMRLSSSLETTIAEEHLPLAVIPVGVRIKQRRRFVLGSLGIGADDVFAFDFTLVFAGSSRAEAEKKQSLRQVTEHQVEIECLRPRNYLKSCNMMDACLAASLLLKMIDFIQKLNDGFILELEAINPNFGLPSSVDA
jgi:hypothetical protein